MGRKGTRTGASSASAASRAGGETFTTFAAATAAALSSAGGAGGSSVGSSSAKVTEWDTRALGILRSAGKRDPTTRARALTEVLNALDEVHAIQKREASVGKAFVEAWGERFVEIVNDREIGVRAVGMEVMGRVVVVFRKRSQSILRKVLGKWVGGLGDDSAVVVGAVEKGLQEAFGGDGVRKKLIGVFGKEICKFCETEVEGVRESGDPASLRRAVSAARWVVVGAHSLEVVHELLDTGFLEKVCVGVKVKKKGVGKVAAAKEACEFASEVLVPELAKELRNSEDRQPSNSETMRRAENMARLAEVALASGERVGWDLALSLMSNDLVSAFGNWLPLRIALEKALSVQVASKSALTAVLPFLMLLPAKSEDSVEIVRVVLTALHKGLLPTDGATQAVGLKSAGHGLRALYINAALPAYVECLTYSIREGAERWCGERATATDLVSEFDRNHLRIALVCYLKGNLCPPLPVRGQLLSRKGGTRRRPSSNGDVGVNFAKAVMALGSSGMDMESFVVAVVDEVLPVQNSSLELSDRIASFAGDIARSNSFVDLACDFVRRCLFATIVDAGGVLKVEEQDELSVMSSLALFAGFSKHTDVGVVTQGEGTASSDDICSYALAGIERFPSNTNLVDSASVALVWVASKQMKRRTSEEVRAALSTESEVGDSVFRSVLSSAALPSDQKFLVISTMIQSLDTSLGSDTICSRLRSEAIDSLAERVFVELRHSETRSQFSSKFVDNTDGHPEISFEAGLAFMVCILSSKNGVELGGRVLSGIVEQLVDWLSTADDVRDPLSLCEAFLLSDSEHLMWHQSEVQLSEYVAVATLIHAVPVSNAAVAFCAGLASSRRVPFLEGLSSGISDCLVGMVSGKVTLDIPASLQRVQALGRAWSTVVDSLGLDDAKVSVAYRKLVETVSGALRSSSSGICSSGYDLCQVYLNTFAITVILAVGVARILPRRASAMDVDQFLVEYERVASLEVGELLSVATSFKSHMGSCITIGGPNVPTGENDLPHLSAEEVSLACVKVLLLTNERHVGISQSSRSRNAALLELLRTSVRTEAASRSAFTANALWSTVESAMSSLGVVLSPIAPQVVTSCVMASGGGGLFSCRSLFDAAVLAVRRNADSEEAGTAIRILAAALDSWSGDPNSTCAPTGQPLPDWFNAQLGLALRTLRRTLESSKVSGAGRRGAAGLGALLTASAISVKYDLSDDDWGFWSFAALDCLREAQLLDLDRIGHFGKESCYMAKLGSEIVRSVGFEASPNSATRGCDSQELVRHGAWAGVKILRWALANPGEECPIDGVVDLMRVSVQKNALIQEGKSLLVEPGDVYELIPFLSHSSVDVRTAVFGVVSTIACDDLPRFMETALRRDEKYSSEEEESRAMRELIPGPLRNSLEWPRGADPHEASHLELGFFLSWLLYLTIVKGVDHAGQYELSDVSSGSTGAPGSGRFGTGGDSQATQEDMSFRRVSLAFLRADKRVFSEFFSRCVDVVIDGTVAEKSAAASATSCISENLTSWMLSMEPPVSLDSQVGQCAGAAFALALQVLPALSREHIADEVDHGTAKQVEDFVRRRISPIMISEEVRKVRDWTASLAANELPAGTGTSEGDGSLATRGSAAAREVWASYTLSEVTLEVVLKLPDLFPLQAVEVEDAEGNTRIGKALWRKTLLQMTTLLRARNGSLAEAISVWRRSLDLRLGGLDDCPVCYSVLHLSNSSLPSVRCGTCSSVYHASCLYKWFTKSSTRSCPMCRSTF